MTERSMYRALAIYLESPPGVMRETLLPDGERWAFWRSAGIFET